MPDDVPKKFHPPSPINGNRLPVGHAPWKPGESGNPSGIAKQKGTSVSKWLARIGDMDEDQLEAFRAWRGKTVNAKAALRLMDKAMSEDERFDSSGIAALALAADRVEGGVDRTVHLSHRQEPTMSPEAAAEALRNAGIIGPAEVAKLPAPGKPAADGQADEF